MAIARSDQQSRQTGYLRTIDEHSLLNCTYRMIILFPEIGRKSVNFLAGLAHWMNNLSAELGT